jgi:AbiV family abortive infection protein
MGMKKIDRLKGAWLARVQCGVLLTDANTLYERRAYSSALAITLFANEELGKSHMRLDGWAGKRRPPLRPSRKDPLQDHEEKQWRGMLTVPSGPETEALLETVTAAPVDQEATREQSEACEKLYEITEEAPKVRHQLRMRCLFVDWDDTAGRWLTPCGISAHKAYDELCNAIYNYNRAWTDRSPSEHDNAIKALQAAWPDRPPLPNLSQPAVPHTESRRP